MRLRCVWFSRTLQLQDLIMYSEVQEMKRPYKFQMNGIVLERFLENRSF